MNSQDQQQESKTNNVSESPGNRSTASLPSVAAVAQSSQTEEAPGSATMTITETASAPLEDELLSLTLRGRASVTWDEGVVDNEGLGRKSSKRCCIFHKQRAFDESSTDTSDYDSDRSGASSASGASGDGRKPAAKKIARPKQGKGVPDSQRFHA
eukprot:CAMPEP_0119003232 /NCGR_PEP_ID=MMETSP1176-20130426/439_1 /TAXON_ID=265551 /ORGANISM="Synedropsis recta cf, Strain CCMP1620" /LENGTH=154 /DNA_ID=CAMNT_0006954811 /DNA_START=35 /DNA_END=499 /DNA_ORIENTATION=-